jgi:hypothetical protein
MYPCKEKNLIFEALPAVFMRILVFWDVWRVASDISKEVKAIQYCFVRGPQGRRHYISLGYRELLSPRDSGMFQKTRNLL